VNHTQKRPSAILNLPTADFTAFFTRVSNKMSAAMIQQLPLSACRRSRRERERRIHFQDHNGRRFCFGISLSDAAKTVKRLKKEYCTSISIPSGAAGT